MHRLHIRICLFASTLACLPALTAFGADVSQISVQKVATGLKSPVSVAVRPDGTADQHEVFVAESGAGRIVKFSSGKPGKSADVVAGFSTHSAPADNQQTGGVQSLYFLDHTRLVVAGRDEDEKPFVRLYDLSATQSPLTADQHKQDVNVAGDDDEPPGPLTFHGIGRTQPNERVADVLILTAAGASESAGLLFVPVRAGTLADVAPLRLAGAKLDSEVSGIAAGKSGHIVIASGARNIDRGAKLQFFNPVNRRVVMQVPAGLQRIAALAYSRKSGNLYAANSPTTNDDHAGVYRIDDADRPNAPACTVVKIADIPSPTALAFTDDGALYVTSFGEAKSEKPGSGTLLKLTGDL